MWLKGRAGWEAQEAAVAWSWRRPVLANGDALVRPGANKGKSVPKHPIVVDHMVTMHRARPCCVRFAAWTRSPPALQRATHCLPPHAVLCVWAEPSNTGHLRGRRFDRTPPLDSIRKVGGSAAPTCERGGGWRLWGAGMVPEMLQPPLLSTT